MYHWYRVADVCYVYLADVPATLSAILSVGNHVTVLQLVRGPTSARLRSALGRWNPVEQTGLCIYSCFRTYRLELFNRVLPNQPTYSGSR
jgi:hypothetical protein